MTEEEKWLLLTKFEKVKNENDAFKGNKHWGSIRQVAISKQNNRSLAMKDDVDDLVKLEHNFDEQIE